MIYTFQQRDALFLKMFLLEAFDASGTSRKCYQPKLVPDFLSSTIL